MVESSRKINDVKLTSLFDFGAVDHFISPTCERNNFNSSKLSWEIKQVVGPSVDNCIVELGVCVTLAKVYVTSLGTYDLIIGMHYLEEHQVFLDCYRKKVLCVDVKGKAIESEVIK